MVVCADRPRVGEHHFRIEIVVDFDLQRPELIGEDICSEAIILRHRAAVHHFDLCDRQFQIGTSGYRSRVLEAEEVGID